MISPESLQTSIFLPLMVSCAPCNTICSVYQRCSLDHRTQSCVCDTVQAAIHSIYPFSFFYPGPSPIRRIKKSTTLAPDPFNIIPRGLKTFFKIFNNFSVAAPSMTQLERAGANNSPLVLSYLVAFKWCPECEPPGSSKAAGSLSREVIQVENLCLSAPQCRLPTYYESFHLLFDGTGSDLCPWLDHINVVALFQLWTIIHTFSFHSQSLISVS